MTMPRQILPGTTYFLTRRCADREFRLRPSAAVNGIFGYVLAIAAERYGIAVHVACVMSNHIHLLVTDPDARLPEFTQYLDAMVARAMNALLGRSGWFWDEQRVSELPLSSPEDVVEKAAYTLSNPVAAGLVARGSEWPGLWTDPRRVGSAALVFERPKVFFSSKMPERATLELVAPPGFSADAFRDEVLAAVAANERDAQASAAARHVGFLGAKRVLAQSPTTRPSSRDRRRRGDLHPRITARDKSIRVQAITQLQEFLATYREAQAKFSAGIRDVVFPAGTYLMRVLHGVNCAVPA